MFRTRFTVILAAVLALWAGPSSALADGESCELSYAEMRTLIRPHVQRALRNYRNLSRRAREDILDISLSNLHVEFPLAASPTRWAMQTDSRSGGKERRRTCREESDHGADGPPAREG
jgi:hypothetical protein